MIDRVEPESEASILFLLPGPRAYTLSRFRGGPPQIATPFERQIEGSQEPAGMSQSWVPWQAAVRSTALALRERRLQENLDRVGNLGEKLS